MSYIRSQQIAKTVLALLFGLPFVFGVFSNARPAMPNDSWHQQAQAPQLRAIQAQPLFSSLNAKAEKLSEKEA